MGHDLGLLAGPLVLHHDHASLDGLHPRQRHLGERPIDQRLGHRRARQQRDAQPPLDHPLGRLDVVELHHAARDDARAPEQRVGEVVVGRGPVEQDELRAMDRRDVDPPGRGERMVGPRHQHQLVLEQGAVDDARIPHLAHHRQLHLAPHHHVHQLLGVRGPDHQPHVGEALGVARQQLRQDVGADRRRGADGQLAGDPRGQLRDQGRATPQRLQRALGVRQERPTGMGQLHAGAGASEQGRAQLRLQALDARRERRLAHIQQLRGTAEVALARDRDEPLHLGVQHRMIDGATLGIA
ncbi:MAG: hypothetical protein U0667_16660 [Chloroflexota bacterium]